VIPEVQPPITEEALAELFRDSEVLPKRHRHAALDLCRLISVLNAFSALFVADQWRRAWHTQEHSAFGKYITTLENLEADCRRRAEEIVISIAGAGCPEAACSWMRASLIRQADKFAAQREAILKIGSPRPGLVGSWTFAARFWTENPHPGRYAGLRDWQNQRDFLAEELRKMLETANPPIKYSEEIVDRFLAELSAIATGRKRSDKSIKVSRYQRPNARVRG
jgi:hypothetical protein